MAQVRMEDVARRAGVSTMSVSRALNAPALVSEPTRARIAKAIEDLDYLPNRVAGSLASSRSNLVAAIVPTLSNPPFANMLQGLSEHLRALGLFLMTGDSGYALKGEQALITAFLAHRPCGIILHNTRHTEASRVLLRRARIPIVETGNLTRQPLDSVVSYSNFAAARAMTRTLVELGYRRIVFVGQPVRFNERARERRRGFRAALGEADLNPKAALILEAPAGLQSGAETLVRVIEARPDTEAIFFGGDVLAIGAILECHRRGWAVPGRVAIATFDDYEMAVQVTPSLTSIRIPRAEIGRRAAEILFEHPRRSAPARMDVGFEIVRRNST